MCDTVLVAPTAGPVCETCWAAVPWYEAPLCAVCGAKVPVGVTCRCEARPPHVARLASAASYDGTMRAVVQAFKYAGHQSIGRRLASHLLEHPHLHIDEIDVVVPVPLHPWRRVRRGYNQAERIARHLGPPVLHALARPHWTQMQAGLTASERRRNLRGALALAPRLTPHRRRRFHLALDGARVLLVDDVVTTGGTLSACAQLLREAGARDVRAATAARTERRPDHPSLPRAGGPAES